MVTIKQIAEESGFSQATVSRLLNEDPTLTFPLPLKIRSSQWQTSSAMVKRQNKFLISRKIALLTSFTAEEELQDVYFNTLKELILEQSKNANLAIDIFHDLDQLIAKGKNYEGFIGIGADELSPEKLAKLHEVTPIGIYLDINPYPDKFDSVPTRPLPNDLKRLRPLTAGWQKTDRFYRRGRFDHGTTRLSPRSTGFCL